MAGFRRIKVFTTMMETGLVPVFYNADVETSKQVARACWEGGTKLIEFTNRGDHAIDVFTELVKHCMQEIPELIIGVGSIVDPYTAGMYIAHGASFVVGPILNPEVAKLCNRRKVAYLPGCGSASEISTAEELGCEIVKVFPGSEVGGPAFVKSVLGPCPWASIMPTGGVDCTDESLRAWFGAGVACVGIGSNLISGEIIKTGDYKALSERVRNVLSMIASIRGEK